MNYGVVSDLWTESEVAVMRSKRISGNNLFNVSNCQVLASRLRQGDTVILVSVNIFSSIAQFVIFAKSVVTANASLRIIEEPYLQVGNGKYWRDAVVRDINYRMELEKKMMVSLSKNGLRMDNPARLNLTRHLAKFDLAVMAKNYSADGILHRG